VLVIDSGDELSADPGGCEDHQIPASNGAMLAAQIAAALPARVTRLGPVPDRIEALGEALDGAGQFDVIVTSGGASVGDHDLIRPALVAWGAELDFWKVALKPGKPIMLARKGGQLVLGLPGNPVSSSVTAFLFLLPLLRALSGAARPLPHAITAKAAEDLPSGGSRQEFLRGAWDGRWITAQLNQDSGALGALAAANALIERPIDAPPVTAGEPVSAYLLENGGIA
jgi:molybdopterin molybdotransferase